MSTFRTFTAAGIATVALASGALFAGSTAQAEDGPDAKAAPLARPAAQRAIVASCDGGAVIKTHMRSMNVQSIPTGTTAEIEGSQWSVRGPKKGTDLAVVTLSAMASSGAAGTLMTAQLYKDGVGTQEKYFAYNGVLSQDTVQFCTKIRKGLHTLSVRVTDGGGSGYLYYPTVNYQLSK